MSLVKTQIIVLHRYAYSDSSWVVKAIASDLGMVSLLVKGAKRKDSPFRNAFDPLSLTEVVLGWNPRRDLQMPREAVLLRWHTALRADLERTALAQVMAEVLLRLTPHGEHFKEEFQLLLDALQWLDQGITPVWVENPTTTHVRALSLWLLQLADCLGYALRFDDCVQCGRPLHQPPADLRPLQGGGICHQCHGEGHTQWTKALLQDLYSSVKNRANDSNVADLVCLHRVESFLLFYLRLHLQSKSELKSFAWLQELRNIPTEEQ